MPELGAPGSDPAPGVADQSDEAAQADRVPLTARLLLHQSLTARRAGAIIAAFAFIITVAGGILERALDHREFPNIGKGLWFSLQTVTTVGYGDVTPKLAAGRIIAAVVMLTAIGFLAVITASVTAALVESGRRRYALTSELDVTERLDDVSERLARIEAALNRLPPSRPPDGIGSP
jgi:voltage-gated potassium channel